MDGTSFGNLDNLYLSQVRDKDVESHTLKDDVDKKWKKLDANVVNQRNQIRLGQECNEEKYPLKIYDKNFGHLTNGTDPRDGEGEDSQKISQWFRQRRQLTGGPPLRSHLDDDELDFYEFLRKEGNKIRPETKMVANLPKRFVDLKDNVHNTNWWSINSSPPLPRPNLLKPKIVKSTTRLFVPTRKTSDICKKEVCILYQKLKKCGIPTEEERCIDATSTCSSSVPVTVKTSPVFVTVFKNNRSPTSSTAIQTDKPIIDKPFYPFGSFAEENINVRPIKETREQCTQKLREMDSSYRGRLRGRGPRIGEYRNIKQDEIFCPGKNEAVNTRPLTVTLSKTGYYCIPNIDTLNKMADNNDWRCVWVKDFEIGHRDHGKAVFPGYTNVYGLNFDEIVKISHKTFELYPDHRKEPPFGTGLNKHCTVTLYKIWPEDKEKGDKSTNGTTPCQGTSTRDAEETVQKNFVDFLQRCCKKFKGNFVNYCPEHGEWVFQVQQIPSDGDDQPVPLAHVDSNEDL